MNFHVRRLNVLCGFVALAGSVAVVQPSLAFPGGDVILSGIPDVANHGAVGGIRGYTIGSHTCNIGTQNVEWISDGPPGLAMNAYRLHDGRLMQIGMSWVKTACCAANTNACGLPSCFGGSSTALGVGCRDTYSSGWNSIQGNLGPRSMFNAYTGAFTSIPGGSFNAITRRLQIAEADMNPTTYPGALYFVEGVYTSLNDSIAGNWYNNASYQRITLTSFNMALTGQFYTSQPAINAWRDHGNGANVPDNDVQISNVNIPGEGRFIIANKVRDNGNGTWRYDYAVFNINSHRSGGSLRIPVPAGVNVTNIGFHDVEYHSGETYDNTDWAGTRLASEVLWASPQTFAQNPNSNALRWGMMYNYWFTADTAPQTVQATLGAFMPGDPGSVQFPTQGPVAACTADIAPGKGDGSIGVPDLLMVINAWGACASPCVADIEPPSGDGDVGIPDLLAIIENWGPCK